MGILLIANDKCAMRVPHSFDFVPCLKSAHLRTLDELSVACAMEKAFRCRDDAELSAEGHGEEMATFYSAKFATTRHLIVCLIRVDSRSFASFEGQTLSGFPFVVARYRQNQTHIRRSLPAAIWFDKSAVLLHIALVVLLPQLPYDCQVFHIAMDTIPIHPIPGFREPVCSISHLVGAAFFAILAFVLVRRGRGDWTKTVSLAVLSVSSVAMLSLSAVYHMLWPGIGRDVMHRIDIAGVFVLIAGTVTPIHIVLFRGLSRWVPLIIVWGVAVTGITLRMVFFSRLPPGSGTIGFVILGWGGALSTVTLWRRYGWSFVEPLVYGGAAYTLGAVLLAAHWPVLVPGVVGPHELWHFAVLAGLGYHWFFVFQICDHRSTLRTATTKFLDSASRATIRPEPLPDDGGMSG